MSDKPSPMWRSALDIVVNSISAEHFREDLPWLREECEDDPDDVGAIYTGMLVDWFVESTGLFAALQLPPEKVPAALAEIHEALAHLDFDKERKRLKRDERRYYDCFAPMAATLFAELAREWRPCSTATSPATMTPKLTPTISSPRHWESPRRTRSARSI